MSLKQQKTKKNLTWTLLTEAYIFKSIPDNC